MALISNSSLLTNGLLVDATMSRRRHWYCSMTTWWSTTSPHCNRLAPSSSISSSSRVPARAREATTTCAVLSDGFSRTWLTRRCLSTIRCNRHRAAQGISERPSSSIRPMPGACSQSPRRYLTKAVPLTAAEPTTLFLPCSMASDCVWVKRAGCTSRMSTSNGSYWSSGKPSFTKAGLCHLAPSSKHSWLSICGVNGQGARTDFLSISHYSRCVAGARSVQVPPARRSITSFPTCTSPSLREHRRRACTIFATPSPWGRSRAGIGSVSIHRHDCSRSRVSGARRCQLNRHLLGDNTDPARSSQPPL